MNRRRCLWAILLVGAIVAGCAVCKSPYDYTGPVTSPGACPHCGVNDRAGSAITGSDGPATFAEPTVAPSMSPPATTSNSPSSANRAPASRR